MSPRSHGWEVSLLLLFSFSSASWQTRSPRPTRPTPAIDRHHDAWQFCRQQILPFRDWNRKSHLYSKWRPSTDRFCRLLSTVDGQESVLSTVEYVASILHHLSQSTPWIAGRLRLLAARNTKTASKRSKFQSLSALASETRCNLRLFTLLQLWSWGSETIRSPPTDPILHALTLLQVIINIVGQLLENVAYLASKGIVSKRLVNKYGGIETWYIWSTRGWLAHIYLQFFVLWRKHVLRQQRDGKFAVGAIASAEEVRAWRKSFVNNVLWAPLCVHWCLEEGIGIPESLTSLGSLLAGTWGLRDMWVATARSP